MSSANTRPAEYLVPAAHRKVPAPPHPSHARGPAAIFVAHGMGQQIPFQTLEAVAEGLLKHSPHGSHRPGRQIARTVAVGGERLQRVELTIALPDQTTREVHVYEGYWAPFTEGQVTLRNVVAFLVRSGIGGIQLGTRDFRRWMFGDYISFPAPIRAVLYLMIALSVVLALAFLNGAILIVAAARAPLNTMPAWLSDALFRDITTILNGLVTALAPLVAVLAWGLWRSHRAPDKARGTGVASIAFFVFALGATLVAAVLVTAAFLYHIQAGADVTSSLFGTRVANLALTFDGWFDAGAGALIVGVVLVGLIQFARTVIRQLLATIVTNAATRALTIGVVIGSVLLFGTVIVVAVATWRLRLQSSAGAWRHGLAWPLLVALSLAVRRLLIQFVGDVAAYIQPQTLDRFYALRQQIKDAVTRAARAIYSDPQYHDVILVGHSLGSVVVYDVLNRLILDRQLAGAAAPEVVRRTRLLLTFGSPLDKTAFIFGTQGSGREAREALAASVQPLITEQAVRPRWINIWSPWDIISGSLDYYDLPNMPGRPRNRNPIVNVKDDRAVTLLVAHVEYWNNPVLFRTILDHLG